MNAGGSLRHVEGRSRPRTRADVGPCSTDQPWPVVGSFCRQWREASDWFLACGFIDPAALSRACDRFELSDRFMPTAGRGVLLRYLDAAGQLGVEIDERTLTWALRREGVGGTEDDVRLVVHAHGSSASIDRAARFVREYGDRADLFHELPSLLLTDQRPVADLLSWLSQEVRTNVG